MIQLNGVSKHYGSVAAVDGISLTVARGRTVALIGPSGCGKSTLLSLLIGLVQPDRGEVLIDGQCLTSRSVVGLRRRMGYVIQDGGLFPHLTAHANACLMADELGWPLTQQEDRLGKLCALTRFPSEALDRYPVELSGGQRQRVSLMRALMLDPDILLMDEPLAALDPMIRADLQDDLKGIFQELAKTVILVTHDLGEAAYFGDTIVLMNQGRIAQSGTFDDLRDRPADPFVRRFLQAHARHAPGFAAPASGSAAEPR
jgi:osmoprotectant transport system ATP-binding protein